MTMTFYIGKDYRKYEKKFAAIKNFIKNKLERNSNAEAFRWIIDEMHKEVERNKKPKKKGGDQDDK